MGTQFNLCVGETQPTDVESEVGRMWFKGSTNEWYKCSSLLPTVYSLVPSGSSFQFPVGYVVFNETGTNPGVDFGYGTWAQIGQGQFLVGQNAADLDFDVAGETGGSKTHSHAGHANHSVTQPNDHAAHTHAPGTLATDTVAGSRKGGTSGAATLTDSHAHTVTTGATANPSITLSHTGTAVDAHSAHDTPGHVPPYRVVYWWKRTA